MTPVTARTGTLAAMDLDDLVMRTEMADALARYSRGIDRCDPDLVRSAFHDDGMLVDYGSPEPLAATTFADYACTKLRDAYLATQHRVTNTSVVSRDGDTAVAESYVLAFHVEDGTDGRILHTFNGRWIDRFERRDGGPWLIVERILRVDWTRKDAWNDDMAGAYVPSARDRSDAVYG